MNLAHDIHRKVGTVVMGLQVPEKEQASSCNQDVNMHLLPIIDYYHPQSVHF